MTFAVCKLLGRGGRPIAITGTHRVLLRSSRQRSPILSALLLIPPNTNRAPEFTVASFVATHVWDSRGHGGWKRIRGVYVTNRILKHTFTCQYTPANTHLPAHTHNSVTHLTSRILTWPGRRFLIGSPNIQGVEVVEVSGYELVLIIYLAGQTSEHVDSGAD